MATFEIPLTPEAQRFSISLAGVLYNLVLRWNSFNDAWTLDILDGQDVPILTGIPLVAEVDLLEPYPYLNFGGRLIARTDGGSLKAPTYDNLGTAGRLYFVTS